MWGDWICSSSRVEGQEREKRGLDGVRRAWGRAEVVVSSVVTAGRFLSLAALAAGSESKMARSSKTILEDLGPCWGL